jgi:hypothetical protein
MMMWCCGGTRELVTVEHLLCEKLFCVCTSASGQIKTRRGVYCTKFAGPQAVRTFAVLCRWGTVGSACVHICAGPRLHLCRLGGKKKILCG